MTTPLLLDLPGLPPALNHAYEARGGGARGLSHTATQWRDDSILLIRAQKNAAAWSVPPHTPLYIGAVFAAPSNLTAWDLDGRWKVLCDALKHGLGVDDAHYWAQFGLKDVAPTPTTRVLVLPMAHLLAHPLYVASYLTLTDPPTPYTAEGDGDLTTFGGYE